MLTSTGVSWFQLFGLLKKSNSGKCVKFLCWLPFSCIKPKFHLRFYAVFVYPHSFSPWAYFLPICYTYQVSLLFSCYWCYFFKFSSVFRISVGVVVFDLRVCVNSASDWKGLCCGCRGQAPAWWWIWAWSWAPVPHNRDSQGIEREATRMR